MIQRLTELQQIQQIVTEHPPANDGLFDGELGAFLFQWYWAIERDEEKLESAFTKLSAIFDRVNSQTSSLKGDSFANGMAGFASVLTHLYQRHDLDLDLNELLGEVDQMLIACAQTNIEAGNVDFYHQAIGTISYLSRRLPDKYIARKLQDLLISLKKHGVSDQYGFRYLSSIGGGKGTSYDLGLAHGLCGLCLTILPLIEQPMFRALARDIVSPAIDFLLYSFDLVERSDSSLTGPQWSIFPILVGSDDHKPELTNRLAYCYGDLNPLLVLVMAQRYLPERADQLQKVITRLQERVCVLQTTAETGIDDAHFCHGASGVALIFQSLYRLTGDTLYQAAYQYWIDQTFHYLRKDISKAQYAGNEASLLEGFSGIGLVLLSHEAETYLPWPELFLLP
ncbi:MAG: lanthionine synthetase LanC family protein [Bacteroidia bacterium]